MASPTNWFAVCCQFRTLPSGWLRALGGLIISRLCSASYTSFQGGSETCLRSRRLVYQSLSSHAPGYLVDDCQLVTDVRVRQLRSADTRTLAVNRTSSSFGNGTVAAAGTRVWNSLPPDLRQPGLSYGQFRRSLKTFLFGQCDHGAVWTVLTVPCRNIFTYLLTYLMTGLGY